MSTSELYMLRIFRLVTLLSFLCYALFDVTPVVFSLQRVSKQLWEICSFKYSAYFLRVFEMFNHKGSETAIQNSG